MANHCSYCDTRRPAPTPNYPHGTRMMVIEDQWCEFCEKCGDDSNFSLTNAETGETATLAEVYDLIT